MTASTHELVSVRLCRKMRQYAFRILLLPFMRYYLETNALRSLGSAIIRAPALLNEAFTSVFAVFELIKKIGREEDSSRRIAVFKALVNSDLVMRNIMPDDLLREAYGWSSHAPTAGDVRNAMMKIIVAIEKGDAQTIEHEEHYMTLVNSVEAGALEFQQALRYNYTGPKPAPEKIEISWADLLQPRGDTPQAPPADLDTRHPAYIFMDIIRDEKAVKTYRALDLPDSLTIDDAEILSRYDRRLDMFFFASHAYELRKRALRQSPEKNDMQDLLHTAYLSNNDAIIVSDDKIFVQILPSRNRMSVAEFRARQLGRANNAVEDIAAAQKSQDEFVADDPVTGTEQTSGLE